MSSRAQTSFVFFFYSQFSVSFLWFNPPLTHTHTSSPTCSPVLTLLVMFSTQHGAPPHLQLNTTASNRRWMISVIRRPPRSGSQRGSQLWTKKQKRFMAHSGGNRWTSGEEKHQAHIFYSITAVVFAFSLTHGLEEGNIFRMSRLYDRQKRLQSSNSLLLVRCEGIDWWEDGMVEMKCPSVGRCGGGSGSNGSEFWCGSLGGWMRTREKRDRQEAKLDN